MGNDGSWVGWTLLGLVSLAVLVFETAAAWKLFAKAGKPGWAVLIPIYRVLLFLQIVRRPWWWLLLLLIPVVDLVIVIVLAFDLAKAFGQGVAFGFGLLLLAPVFIPILGFSDAAYQEGVAPYMPSTPSSPA